MGMLGLFAGFAALTAYAQQGRWAAADDTTAKFMIDAERQWAEAACTHNRIAGCSTRRSISSAITSRWSMGAKVQSEREKTEPTNPDAWFGPILGSSGMVFGKSSRRRIRNSTANRPARIFRANC